MKLKLLLLCLLYEIATVSSLEAVTLPFTDLVATVSPVKPKPLSSQSLEEFSSSSARTSSSDSILDYYKSESPEKDCSSIVCEFSSPLALKSSSIGLPVSNIDTLINKSKAANAAARSIASCSSAASESSLPVLILGDYTGEPINQKDVNFVSKVNSLPSIAIAPRDADANYAPSSLIPLTIPTFIPSSSKNCLNTPYSLPYPLQVDGLSIPKVSQINPSSFIPNNFEIPLLKPAPCIPSNVKIPVINLPESKKLFSASLYGGTVEAKTSQNLSQKNTKISTSANNINSLFRQLSSIINVLKNYKNGIQTPVSNQPQVDRSNVLNSGASQKVRLSSPVPKSEINKNVFTQTALPELSTLPLTVRPVLNNNSPTYSPTYSSTKTLPKYSIKTVSPPKLPQLINSPNSINKISSAIPSSDFASKTVSSISNIISKITQKIMSSLKSNVRNGLSSRKPVSVLPPSPYCLKRKNTNTKPCPYKQVSSPKSSQPIVTQSRKPMKTSHTENLATVSTASKLPRSTMRSLEPPKIPTVSLKPPISNENVSPVFVSTSNVDNLASQVAEPASLRPAKVTTLPPASFSDYLPQRTCPSYLPSPVIPSIFFSLDSNTQTHQPVNKLSSIAKNVKAIEKLLEMAFLAELLNGEDFVDWDAVDSVLALLCTC